MAEITLTLRDTPAGGVSIHSSFLPAVGSSCTPAQAQALDLQRATVKQWPVGIYCATPIEARDLPGAGPGWMVGGVLAGTLTPDTKKGGEA